MTVKVVKPIEITEAVLTASSIPEPDASVGEVEWIEDRFNGIDVSSIIPSSHVVRDMKLYLGKYYIIAGPQFSNPTMYVISGSGSLVSRFSMPVFSLAITLHNNFIYSVTGSNSIFKHKISDGSVIQSIDISSNVENARAVDFYSSKFFIFDSSDSKIKQFNDTLVYDNFEFTIAAGSLSVSSVKIFDGFIYSVELITANSIKKYSLSGELSNAINFESGLSCFDLKSDGYYFMPYSGSKLLLSYNDNFVYSGLYQPNERAILTSTHKLYQCVKATNIRPDLGATGDENETWIEVSPTNRWSIFTDTINSASVITKDSGARHRTFILKPQQKFTSCAVFGCSGLKQVHFQVFTSGNVLRQSVKVDMIDHDAALEWGLDDASPAFIDSAFFDGLKYFDGDYFKLIIEAQSGFKGSVKLFAFGIDRLIGEAINESMRKNYIDLSTYDNDQFGNTRITKRPVVALNTYSALVENARIEVVDRFLNSLAGEFNLWLADIGNGQKILTYGAYERTPTEINHNSYRVYTATIRSAI